MKLGPWTLTEDGAGAYRALAGKDGKVVANRVLFIEKTPRVRIRPESWGMRDQDHLNWAARDFKGGGPEDQKSRDWCDEFAKFLGYES